MLTAMLREDGAEVRRIAIGDDPIELLHRLTAEYESFKPDIIITSGGISHGKYEVVRNAIAKAHEADILVPVSWFYHVSQQPGGSGRKRSRFQGSPRAHDFLPRQPGEHPHLVRADSSPLPACRYSTACPTRLPPNRQP